MKTLSIDIETYSDIPLQKTGVSEDRSFRRPEFTVTVSLPILKSCYSATA